MTAASVGEGQPVVCEHCHQPIKKRRGHPWATKDGVLWCKGRVVGQLHRHEPAAPVVSGEVEDRGTPFDAEDADEFVKLHYCGSRHRKIDACPPEPVGVVEQPEAPTHESPDAMAERVRRETALPKSPSSVEPVVQPVDDPPRKKSTDRLTPEEAADVMSRAGGPPYVPPSEYVLPRDAPPVDPRPTREAPTWQAVEAALATYLVNTVAEKRHHDAPLLLDLLDELGALRVASESRTPRLVRDLPIAEGNTGSDVFPCRESRPLMDGRFVVWPAPFTVPLFLRADDPVPAEVPTDD